MFSVVFLMVLNDGGFYQVISRLALGLSSVTSFPHVWKQRGNNICNKKAAKSCFFIKPEIFSVSCSE